MDDANKNKLVAMVVAPYIQKATALIGVPRKVGGNQFRHMLATFAILIDYHYTDPVLLKASLIHDLLEDFPSTKPSEISCIDQHGKLVLELVKEVTRSNNESKGNYLKRLLISGSNNAKILKVADRISNLTDLHPDIISLEKIKLYLDDTSEYIYPMAVSVNQNMAYELKDLIKRRKTYLKAASDKKESITLS